jgi:lipid-A-disaccharide synthase
MVDLFIIAGEASGDQLGEGLLQALKSSNLKVMGIGGPKMRAVGMETIFPMENLQVMGFVDVLFALPHLISCFNLAVDAILKAQPKVVLTIDYPGFNLRLARKLRKKGFKGKICHYVCPSVWAWGKKRIGLMAENLDLLLSILPFEKQLFDEEVAKLHSGANPRSQSRFGFFANRLRPQGYIDLQKTESALRSSNLHLEASSATPSEKTKLRVEYIGHPLAQKISPQENPDTHLIAFFPGSRTKEIERNFPYFIRLAITLKRDFPNYNFVVSVSQEKYRPLLKKMAPDLDLRTPAEMKKLKPFLAVAKSGTITLELALQEIPTVVTYAVSPLDVFIAKHIFRISLPYYALPNLIANKTIFPELIGPDLTNERLLKEVKNLMINQDMWDRSKAECSSLRALLGKENANTRSAQLILSLLKE